MSYSREGDKKLFSNMDQWIHTLYDKQYDVYFRFWYYKFDLMTILQKNMTHSWRVCNVIIRQEVKNSLKLDRLIGIGLFKEDELCQDLRIKRN